MENKKIFRNGIAILLMMILCILAECVFSAYAEGPDKKNLIGDYTIDIIDNETGESVFDLEPNSIMKGMKLRDFNEKREDDNTKPKYVVKLIVNISYKMIIYANRTGEDGKQVYEAVTEPEVRESNNVINKDEFSFTSEKLSDSNGNEQFGNFRIYPNAKANASFPVFFQVVNDYLSDSNDEESKEQKPIKAPEILPESGFVNGKDFYLSAEKKAVVQVVCTTGNCSIELYCGEKRVSRKPKKTAGENGEYIYTFDVTSYVRKEAKNDECKMEFYAKLIYPKDTAANIEDIPTEECNTIQSDQFELNVIGKVRFKDETTDSITSDETTIHVAVNKDSGQITIPGIVDDPTEVDADGKAQVELPEDKKPRKDGQLTLQYENDNGEKESFTVEYTYHQWEPIRIVSPKGTLHLYSGKSNKDLPVEIAVTGEEGKTIQATLIHPEGTWKASTVNGKENHFSTTYDRLHQTTGIEFVYANKENDPDLKTTVTIKNKGNPEEGSLVVVWHTLSVGPVDNDTKEISVTGAVPGSTVWLTIDGDEENRRDQKADKKGSLSFNTYKLEPGRQIVITSVDEAGGKSSANTTVTKKDAGEIKSISELKVTGDQDKKDIPKKDEIYYTNCDIRVQGSGHPEQAIIAQLTGSDGKTVPILPEGEESGTSTDENGQWMIVVPAGDYADGDYQLSIRYRDYDELNTTIGIRVDHKCDILHLNSNGRIEVYENDRSFGIESGEGETLSEATFTYYTDTIITGKISEDGRKASFEFADPNMFFHLDNDQREDIYVKVKDFTGNEAIYPIHVIPQNLTLTVNGEAIPESLYLKNDGGITFRAEGKTESIAQIYMDNGEQPIAELAAGGEFVLDTGNAGKPLNEMDEIKIRIVLPEQEDTLVRVIYDPECGLEASQTNGTDGSYILMEEKGDYLQIDKAVTEIIGSADPDAKVTLTIRHKDSAEDEPVIFATARDGREFRFSGLELLPGDMLTLNAADEAGNEAAPITLKVRISAIKSPAGIFLLVAGLILFVFSLMFFLNTHRKIKQVEEISAANAATIRQEEKH